MSLLSRKVHIIYHNDMDGMCCAAHLVNLFTNYALHPVKTSSRGKALDKLVSSIPQGDLVAIVDFQYHPRADIWVDHHESSILPTQKTGFHLYDPHAKSAFAILDPGHRSAHLVDAIDAALYPTVGYIFESTDPVMTLNRHINTMYPHETAYSHIVEVLAKNDMDFGKTISTLNLNPQELLDSQLSKAEDILQFMCIHEAMFSVTCMANLNEYPRYSEYYMKPFVEYAIRQVSAGSGNTQIEIGYNRFAFNNPVHIGEFMSKSKLVLNGGGHKGIGGCTVKNSNAEKLIRSFITHAIGGVDVEEEMEKLAVDKDDPVEKRAEPMVKNGEAKNIIEAREKVAKQQL